MRIRVRMKSVCRNAGTFLCTNMKAMQNRENVFVLTSSLLCFACKLESGLETEVSAVVLADQTQIFCYDSACLFVRHV